MCDKRRLTKKEARTALNMCIAQHRPECRMYPCPECHPYWHLSSSEHIEGYKVEEINNESFKKFIDVTE